MHEYLDEHQRKAVEALENVSNIFNKYNIKFYLLAGSTLGAVRHEGFIPWDDDIDIGISCNDYEIVGNILEKELDKTFKYITCENTNEYSRLFGKILYKNVSCIDIFILTKIPDNKFLRRVYWFKRSRINLWYKIKNKNKDIKFKNKITKVCNMMFFSILSLFVRREQVIKIARNLEKKYENENCKSYVNLYSIYSLNKELILKEWLENPVQVKFEDNLYWTVGSTHDYLTKLYGNYMELPPESMQIKRHTEVFKY